MAHSLLIEQPSLEGFCPISDAVDKLAHDSGADERGAIYTRREVVEFMLDLAGYAPSQPLHQTRLLEPSFGGGEFLLAAINRLMLAFKAAGGESDLVDCIRAVELHRSTFNATREKVDSLLFQHGLNAAERSRLTSAWLTAGDFLLHPMQGRFDFVIGNLKE